MLGITLQSFTPDTRETTLQHLLGHENLNGATAQRAENGKPYLLASGGMRAGLAICHIRKSVPPLSLMAVSHEAQLGLDAEVWPSAHADLAFLNLIAANEDAELIQRLRTTGRDAATFLWVIKESALKASGEVMTDPRNVSIEASTNGHFWASASRAATGPVTEAFVRVWQFNLKGWSEPSLVAVALSGPAAKAARRNGISLEAVGLHLQPAF